MSTYQNFQDLAEHACQMKPSGTGSHILASIFTKWIDNPYIRTKLESHTGNNLDALFTHAIEDTEKQKIHAIDFDKDKKTYLEVSWYSLEQYIWLY